MTAFSLETQNNLDLWLQGNLCDEVGKNQIRELIKTNPQEIEDSFYTSLMFGTAGLRGLMGLGPNRLNIYTIRQTTQGIANYVRSYYSASLPQKQLSVVVGYDSRVHSKEFALETAKVFAASGFETHLFQDISPTPLVSFACRYLKATIAVMITASHNPSAYNGYKVYWSYGGQVLFPHDEGMMKEVEKVRRSNNTITVVAEHDSNIHVLGSEIDQAYLKAIASGILWQECDKSLLHLIYSPLHGTGGRLMGRALQDVGIEHVSYVQPQMIPDGTFPTVAKPNPEELEALTMGIDQLKREQGDMFIASDPDADRLGVVVQHQGSTVILTGNQIVSIMCEWIMRRLHETQRLPERYGIIKSCVTTHLIDTIARRWGAHLHQVLPGFKYIAQEIENWEHADKPITFLFGAEESYGSLYGLHARDKDAISAGAVLSEIAWHMKTMRKTLVDALNELYELYGYYFEDLLSLNFAESKEGREKMEHALQQLRTAPPAIFHTTKVVARQDLQSGTFQGDPQFCLTSTFPKADVLFFTLADRTQIVIRPSGTEPKIKIYLFSYSPQYDAEAKRQVEVNSAALKAWILKTYS